MWRRFQKVTAVSSTLLLTTIAMSLLVLMSTSTIKPVAGLVDCSSMHWSDTGQQDLYDSYKTGASGDMNGDSLDDVILGGDSVDLFLNAGDGLFVKVVDSSPVLRIPPMYAADIALADFDRDNDLDVYVCTDEPGVNDAVFFNDGFGNLTFAFEANTNDTGSCVTVVAADFNLDSYPDVIVSNAQDLVVLFNNGSGLQFFTRIDTSGATEKLFLAEMTGNAPPEILAFHGTDIINKLRTVAGVTITTLDTREVYPAAAWIGDFDSDGIQEAAIAQTPGQGGTIVLYKYGVGATPMLIDATASALVMADFNQDNVTDIFFTYANTSDTFGFALGIDSANFLPCSPGATAPEMAATSLFLTGDYDADNDLDLFVVNRFPDLGLQQVLLNTFRIGTAEPIGQTVLGFIGETPNHLVSPLSSDGQVRDDLAVSVLFLRIVEITPSGQEISIDLQSSSISYNYAPDPITDGKGFRFACQVKDNVTAIWSVYLRYENGTVSIDGDPVTLDTNQVKWSFRLAGSWEFVSPQSTLRLEVKLASQDGNLTTGNSSSQLGLESLRTPNSTVVFRWANEVIVDRVTQSLLDFSYNASTQIASFTFPSYSATLKYDPSLEVIISPSDGIGDGVEGDGDSTLLIVLVSVLVPVIVGIALVICLVCLVVSIINRKRIRGQIESHFSEMQRHDEDDL